MIITECLSWRSIIRLLIRDLLCLDMYESSDNPTDAVLAGTRSLSKHLAFFCIHLSVPITFHSP
jgi:hypothetical protein